MKDNQLLKVESVFMGTLVKSWMHHKSIKYITFSVTDECNLRCEYCYFTHKNSKNRMTFDVAKRAVDYILSEDSFSIHDGVVWDFIGGEPSLEIKLIDQICEYILYKMYIMNHKWLNCYRIMVGTNGLLYESVDFQKFIKKYGRNLHVGITVDGSKKKHDLSRIKKDGSGSYDDVVKVLPKWFSQIGSHTTKSTFSHSDLPYLKESIVNLWNLGITNVMANVVFEDVWEEGDDDIYEKQLKELADYVIDNQLWNKVSVRFFSPSIGYPLGDEERKTNGCGSGNMLAVNYKGDFYPCVRFLESALNKQKARKIGDINAGLFYDKIRAFNTLTYDVQNPDMCKNCDINRGCGWCTGFNYDESSDGNIFERQTYLCKMHKANVRANQYFWRRYEIATGYVSPYRYNVYTNRSSQNKYLYILHDDIVSFCYDISKPNNPSNIISDYVYEKAIQFCDDNNMIPVHVGFKEYKKFGYYIGNADSKYYRNEFCIDIVDHDCMSKYKNEIPTIANAVIYRTKTNKLYEGFKDICKLVEGMKVSKITLKVLDYYQWGKDELKKYRSFLIKLKEFVVKEWRKGNYIQIDVITEDLLIDKKQFCDAGVHSLTMSPDGNFYRCAAYYHNNSDIVGNVFDGIYKLSENRKLSMCNNCDANNCQKCFFLNELLTDEKDVAFEVHCVKRNLEQEISVLFLKELKELGLNVPFDINDKIYEPIGLDPLVTIRGNTFANQGFFDYNCE